MNLMTSFFRRDAETATPQSLNRISLTRTFVETGDERCPLAGIWSRLPATNPVDDEPSLPWPALGSLLFQAAPWRAFHFCLTGV